MGKTRDTQQQTQTVTPQRTGEQAELDKLTLAQAKEFDPIQRDLNKNAGNLLNQILGGQSNLPGFLSRIPAGIDEDVTKSIVDKSILDIQPRFQAMGLLDSGVNVATSGKIAGDIRRSVEESNLNTLFNLLNIAVGGQAQIQQPILSQTQMLGQRLAGITPVTTTGTGNLTRKYDFWTSPFTQSMISGGSQAGGAAVGMALAGCWVASEIFGGWMMPKTICTRFFINNLAPSWLKNAYLKYGQKIAGFIRKHKFAKVILTPLFEVFAMRGNHALTK